MSEEWTVNTLKEFILKELANMETYNDRRFSAQEKAVETAFDAAKEAVIKSELGVEKRSDSVYVTIGKLQEALALVMPRAESEQRYTTLMEKINEVNDRTNTTQGRSSGFDKSWGIFLALLGVGLVIIGLILR